MVCSCFGFGMACHTANFRTANLRHSVVSTSFFWDKVRCEPLSPSLGASARGKTVSARYRDYAVMSDGSLRFPSRQSSVTYLQVAAGVHRPYRKVGTILYALNHHPHPPSTSHTSGVVLLGSFVPAGTTGTTTSFVVTCPILLPVRPSAHALTCSGPVGGKNSIPALPRRRSCVRCSWAGTKKFSLQGRSGQ